jgi:hypothetical protein
MAKRDRVQMDTCQIKPGLYQYTAIDDCSRFQVLGLYPRRTAANTLAFLDRVAAVTRPPETGPRIGRICSTFDREEDRCARAGSPTSRSSASSGSTVGQRSCPTGRSWPSSVVGGDTSGPQADEAWPDYVQRSIEEARRQLAEFRPGEEIASEYLRYVRINFTIEARQP